MLPPFLSGKRRVEAPNDEVLQAAMNHAVGMEVPAEYRTMVREQASVGPVEPLGPLNAPDGFHVLIIGAGVTGVLAARVLDGLGLTNFTVVDKNPEPGGTWYVNQYPGCRVDTPRSTPSPGTKTPRPGRSTCATPPPETPIASRPTP